MWYDNDTKVIKTYHSLKLLFRCDEAKIYFDVFNQNDI